MPTKPPKIARVALLSQVKELLKERILDRTYGPGLNLNVDALARELSVSSTPIRESLSHLVAEGLVRAEPYVGFYVSDLPSREYMEQLFDYRMVIEPWAVTEMLRRHPEDQLAVLEGAVAFMKRGRLSKQYAGYRGYSEADEAFHLAIITGSGNEPAMKAYVQLTIQLHISRLYPDHDLDTDKSIAQHVAILDAIRAGQSEHAALLMREHLNASKQSLLEDGN